MTERNKEVAEMFARGATEGSSGHMFIDENTIYSYGRHFPIAKRYGNVFIFTTSSHSTTTSNHKGRVKEAIGIFRKILYLPDCDTRKSIEQKRLNEKEIERLLKLKKRFHLPERKAVYDAEISDMRKQNKMLDEIIPTLIAERI